MRLKRITYLLMWLFAAVTVFAQNEPYQGGSADGSSQSELVTPFAFPTSFQPYIGGIDDGHSKADVINAVFAFPNHFYVFAGGTSDGWTGNLAPGVTILPLTLFQFRGEQENGVNKLLWVTQQEINTSHFEIQRSQNANMFSSLGQTPARGNFNGQSQYQFVDSFPAQGKNFYRLKMTDRDGSFKYSPIVLLEKRDGLLTLIIYPNPVQQMLNIKLNGIVTGEITWTVHDAMGRKVIQQKTASNYGQYGLNVAKLPSGVYVLDVVTSTGSEKIQFTKQ